MIAARWIAAGAVGAAAGCAIVQDVGQQAGASSTTTTTTGTGGETPTLSNAGGARNVGGSGPVDCDAKPAACVDAGAFAGSTDAEAVSCDGGATSADGPTTPDVVVLHLGPVDGAWAVTFGAYDLQCRSRRRSRRSARRAAPG